MLFGCWQGDFWDDGGALESAMWDWEVGEVPLFAF